MVLLQDLSGSMGVGGRLEASREAVGYFFDRARPGDEFALATFASDSTDVDVPFTEDMGALRESVARWEAYGKTALHDAVGRLPEISGDSRNVKRAAILVTDGVDNASALSANEARELVRRAELPVYVLGLESGDPFAVDAQRRQGLPLRGHAQPPLPPDRRALLSDSPAPTTSRRLARRSRTICATSTCSDSTRRGAARRHSGVSRSRSAATTGCASWRAMGYRGTAPAR